MKSQLNLGITGLISGFVMWVVAGLWHNLIIPTLFPDNTAEHEGIFIGLIAYILLATTMTYLYQFYSEDNNLRTGFIFGAIIGFLWVFPHSLALAAAHGSSILYEIQNGTYHLFEQGIGGIIISLVWSKLTSNSQV